MDSDQEIKPTIIIDNGSCFIKSGLGNEDEPSSYFRNCIGYPKKDSKYSDLSGKEFFIGKNALIRKDSLSLNYPIKNGAIQNWDDMEKIWGYIFYDELKVDPVEHNILLTQQIMNPKGEKEKSAQIIFETFFAPGLYFDYSTSLSLYGAGKFTGLILELGGETTQIAPILDGNPKPYKFEKLFYGGNEINDYLFNLFNSNLKMFYNSKYKSSIEDIKEKACYVALDFEEELYGIEQYDYTLPDNKQLILKEERIKAPEAIFKPSFIGKDDDKSLHNLCNKLIEKFDDHNEKKDLYNCIVLSGGNSMFKGLAERLTKEIKAIVPDSLQEEVNVINLPQRKFFAWVGGAILSSISKFKDLVITKQMYEESGSSIFYRNDCYIFK